jgi:hypothetical protein
MDAHDLIARHREHAERVVLAQMLLGGERELRQVAQLLQVGGVHTAFVEGTPVVRHLVVGMLQRGFHALQLQGGDLVAARGFYRFEITRFGTFLRHESLRRGRCQGATEGLPWIVWERPRKSATRLPCWLVTTVS